MANLWSPPSVPMVSAKAKGRRWWRFGIFMDSNPNNDSEVTAKATVPIQQSKPIKA